MSVDLDNFTHPVTGTRSELFITDEEWQRVEQAEKRIRARIASRVRHLVKADGAQDTWKRRRYSWHEAKEARLILDAKLSHALLVANGFEILDAHE